MTPLGYVALVFASLFFLFTGSELWRARTWLLK